MAIRVNSDDHPEIFRAMETYGWLLHSVCGEKPIRLEVVNGRGEVIQIPYDEGVAALALMEQIARTRNMAAPPYEPVGWSRCGDCGFNARCWNAAMQAGDVAIVPGVDQGIARRLRELGVSTISELLTTLDRDSLADVKRARGAKMVRIPADDREQLTLDAIRARASNLYHPKLIGVDVLDHIVIGESRYVSFRELGWL